jgi:ATP-binding cassette subfamily D (ALD) long-chain fatty acid import protein
MGIDREILMLEAKLAEVGSWEKRVKELEVLLGAGGAKATK